MTDNDPGANRRRKNLALLAILLLFIGTVYAITVLRIHGGA